MKKRVTVLAVCAALTLLLSVSVYAAVDANEYRMAAEFLDEKGLSAASLGRRETKRVYRDIESKRFDDPKTVELLKSKAAELGMTDRDMPDDPAELYKAILRYGLFYPTAALTSVQIRALPSGLTYGEILERLGLTKDTGRDEHAYQYTVVATRCCLSGSGWRRISVPTPARSCWRPWRTRDSPPNLETPSGRFCRRGMRVNGTAKPTGRCWSSARIGSGSTVSICRYRTIRPTNTRTDGPPFSRISEDRSR